jgi:hypothetical protein
MNEGETRRLVYLAIVHRATAAMRLDVPDALKITDADGGVYVVHRPLPLSRNQPTQETVMPDNKENAARLREMIASLNAGAPISFGEAYRAALEAGAVALTDQDATRRGSGSGQPGSGPVQGAVSAAGPGAGSPVPNTSRHLADIDDGKPEGERADQAAERDRNLGVRRDDIGGEPEPARAVAAPHDVEHSRTGAHDASKPTLGEAKHGVSVGPAREVNPTGKVK